MIGQVSSSGPGPVGAGDLRVVQVSDTHLAADRGYPQAAAEAFARIVADPPDLVIATGDLARFDPDDDADRQFACAQLRALPTPVLAVPGNHDVGFFDEPALLPGRVERFRQAWGDDRFTIDAGGWRLIGIDPYDTTEAAVGWLNRQAATDLPVAVFIHHPLFGEVPDGWHLPDEVRGPIIDALSRCSVRLIASGHRHRALQRVGDGGRLDVWCPSLIHAGNPTEGGDPLPGYAELALRSDGSVSCSFVRLKAEPVPRRP